MSRTVVVIYPPPLTASRTRGLARREALKSKRRERASALNSAPPPPYGIIGETHVTLGQNASPLTSVFFVLQQRICRDVPPHPDRNRWIGTLRPSGGAWGQSGARRGRKGLVPDHQRTLPRVFTGR